MAYDVPGTRLAQGALGGESLVGKKLQLCILWQGWRSWLLVHVDRVVLSYDISCLVAPMQGRMAVIERVIGILFAYKTKMVLTGRRHAPVAQFVAAAQQAELCDDKGFYAELSKLRPWKSRPLPMLRKKGRLICAYAGGNGCKMG